MIRGLIAGSGVERSHLAGIGVCAPGPLNVRRGMILTPPNFPSWSRMPLKEIVETEIGPPTLVDNDASAAALAEKWFGPARSSDNFVYLLGESGIGCGIVSNGDIFSAHGVAGEVGHTKIDLDGLPCDRGNKGCLELYASPTAVEQQMMRAITSGTKTKILELVGGNADRVTCETIIQAARDGDALAGDTLRAMGRALGAGVVNLTNILEPEAIIVGGRLAQAGDLQLDRLREKVAECTMVSDSGRFKCCRTAHRRRPR